MDTPVTFDWKIRLPDVLGVLRRDYAGRFPQLASAALETLLERLREEGPPQTVGRPRQTRSRGSSPTPAEQRLSDA